MRACLLLLLEPMKKDSTLQGSLLLGSANGLRMGLSLRAIEGVQQKLDLGLMMKGCNWLCVSGFLVLEKVYFSVAIYCGSRGLSYSG